MVNLMHWIFACMEFIMVSNARNLLRERDFTEPEPTIGTIGERYFFTQHRLTGIKEAKKLCENAGGELAAYLYDHEFQRIFQYRKHFFRKGGVLWIDAVYDIEEDGNRWIWPYTSETIRDIKTSPPTDQDGLCGVMDAQMNGGMYEPFIRGHSCDEWSPNTGVLCMKYLGTGAASPTGFPGY